MNDREFYAGAALGFRAWRLDGYLLRPVFKRGAVAWGPGSNRATCGKGAEHDAPNHSCDCGLQAYHEPTSMRGQIKLQRVLEQKFGRRGAFEVFGAVAGAGNLEVHYHGWRASQAQVLGLWCPEVLRSSERHQQVKDAASYYEVPLFDEVEELAEYGASLALPIPADRRPEQPAAIEDPERFAAFLRRHEERLARGSKDE